jgi:hypothetical protein
VGAALDSSELDFLVESMDGRWRWQEADDGDKVVLVGRGSIRPWG